MQPVFKGNLDERTSSDQMMFSRIYVPMLRNLRLRDTCHVGTLSLGYWYSLETYSET